MDVGDYKQSGPGTKPNFNVVKSPSIKPPVANGRYCRAAIRGYAAVRGNS